MISVLLGTCSDLDARLPALTGGTIADPADAVSPEDAAHARRRSTAALRRRALWSRAALRILLARRTEVPASEAASLTIDRGCARCGAAHGRPRAERASLSTSGSAEAVMAATAEPDQSLGVDLERIPDSLFTGFDDFVLHAEETLDPGCPLAARLTSWTLKEAVLKAAGLGLEHPPSELLLGEPAASSHWVEGPLTTALRWRPVRQAAAPAVRGLWACCVPAPSGYAAALAATAPADVEVR